MRCWTWAQARPLSPAALVARGFGDLDRAGPLGGRPAARAGPSGPARARGCAGSTPTSSTGRPTGPTGSGTTGPSSISWSMPTSGSAISRPHVSAVRPGGHVVVGTFAEDGPATCSGLPVTQVRRPRLSLTPSAPSSPSSALVATSTAPREDRCSHSRGWRCGGGRREGRRVVRARAPSPIGRSPGSRPSYSRISIAWASRSRSRYGSPLTSTATRRIVPPVKRQGCAPG